MKHPHFPYAVASLVLTILVLACARPPASPKKVSWDDISHGVHVRKNEPYKQSGFGDCDAKDLINFTCE
jgi:hypothetical protein